MLTMTNASDSPETLNPCQINLFDICISNGCTMVPYKDLRNIFYLNLDEKQKKHKHRKQVENNY